MFDFNSSGPFEFLLGRLAKTGDSVNVDGHRLTVLRAEPTRIRLIRVDPIDARDSGNSEAAESEQKARDDAQGAP